MCRSVNHPNHIYILEVVSTLIYDIWSYPGFWNFNYVCCNVCLRCFSGLSELLDAANHLNFIQGRLQMDYKISGP